MGLFFSFVLFLFGSLGSPILCSSPSSPFLPQPPATLLLVVVLSVCLSNGSLGVFLLTFPTGRFAPRWTWVLVLLWVFQALLFVDLGAYYLAPPVALRRRVLLTWGSTLPCSSIAIDASIRRCSASRPSGWCLAIWWASWSMCSRSHWAC